MPVQRKVFRIEEGARAPVERSADDSLRHHEFMSEMAALRELLGPRAEIDREALEQARGQIAEAQSYKDELALIYNAVERTRNEMAVLGIEAQRGERVPRASRELAAIVAGTERATQSILQAAEEIDRTADALAGAAKGVHEQGLAQDVRERVVQIFEACNFQDLTGQRVSHVLATLRFIEERVARLMTIWNVVEQFEPVVLDKDADGERRFLNGPKLPGDPGHSTQDDIDGMFCPA
jgi:chemotaxis protein CheZ